MISSGTIRGLVCGGVAVIAAMGLGSGADARGATVSVLDDVSTFSTLQAYGGGMLSDPTYDQQTGQGADDFVGDGTNGYYGFYYKYGQIGGTDSLVFRVRLNLLTTQQGVPKFNGNIRIGVDGDGDGNVDLYFGVATGAGQTPEITFQNPTGTAPDANTSPNTSALDNRYGTIAASASNYDYSEVTDGSSYYTNKVNQPNTDAFLTFALPFSSFKTYLESQLSGVTITTSSFLRFVAFSATNYNTVNQDLYGSNGIGTVRYDQGGGFSNYYGVDGKVIPEASTFAQFAMLALGVFGWRRKRVMRDRIS